MKLKVYLLLLTIALFSCSKSYATISISSTGEVPDSALVSIDDLRKANAKMIQLKYAKQELALKDSIIKIDSLEINRLKEDNVSIENKSSNYKNQRNILTIISTFLLGSLIGVIL